MNSSTFHIAGQTIGRVGFGAMQLPGPGVIGPPRDRDEALAVLRRVIEAGVNHIDTAQYYGPDVSNQLIREALYPYPDNLVIVSKVGAERDSKGGWIPSQHPAKLRSGVEDNLRALGVDHLGAVNLRLLDHPAPPSERATLEDQLAEMSALRDEGKIIGVGISTATLDQVRQAHESVGLACVQNAYSLLSRDDQPVLDYCADNDIAYVPYFPLGSAFPGMPKVTDDPDVQAMAAQLGATAAQIGLAWLLGRAPNVCLIPGTSSLAHLEENLAVTDVELSSQDTDRLTRSGARGRGARSA